MRWLFLFPVLLFLSPALVGPKCVVAFQDAVGLFCAFLLELSQQLLVFVYWRSKPLCLCPRHACARDVFDPVSCFLCLPPKWILPRLFLVLASHACIFMSYEHEARTVILTVVGFGVTRELGPAPRDCKMYPLCCLLYTSPSPRD